MTPSPDTADVVAEPDYAADMRLPDGLTCADCAHARRCTSFGFSTAEATSCDFWPSRYRALQSKENPDV